MQKNVKDMVIEQNNGKPILEDDFVAIFPYKSKEKSLVTLVAFRKGSDTLNILGRWRLQNKMICLGENNIFEIRRFTWNPETIVQMHDAIVEWLKTA
ncbi:hypothetical protein J6S46_03525 [Candidatus Saccharibacteria bacterium]|nr:hypothetical protein [Candidatus Saccharibacteria bacterium]